MMFIAPLFSETKRRGGGDTAAGTCTKRTNLFNGILIITPLICILPVNLIKASRKVSENLVHV